VPSEESAIANYINDDIGDDQTLAKMVEEARKYEN